MDVAHFTPWSALAGGILIGLSAALLWILNGRVAGISGIAGQLLRPAPGDARWRIAFLVGLVGGGAIVAALHPGAFGVPHAGSATLLVGGLCVGFGTRLGNGCTSGHGLCGMSRLSPRSIVATIVFIAVGMATVFVMRHVGGAP
ncbi:MAG TPA: YeeE/YedE family protein [Polyangia bacterium]